MAANLLCPGLNGGVSAYPRHVSFNMSRVQVSVIVDLPRSGVWGCGYAFCRCIWRRILFSQVYLVEDQPCPGKFDCGSASFKFLELRICISGFFNSMICNMHIYICMAADLLCPGLLVDRPSYSPKRG